MEEGNLGGHSHNGWAEPERGAAPSLSPRISSQQKGQHRSCGAILGEGEMKPGVDVEPMLLKGVPAEVPGHKLGKI